MREADLAISAGGTTLYELCACGTPSISYSVADNQFGNVRAFDREGLISCAGDIRSGTVPEMLGKLIAAFDRNERSARSERMRHVVDGRGADRIAEALIRLGNR